MKRIGVPLVCAGLLLAAAPAHAQSAGAAVDVEALIDEQERGAGAGSLLRTLSPGAAARRDALSEAGLSLALGYGAYAVAAPASDAAWTADGDIGLAVRWRVRPTEAANGTSFVAYVENRANYTSDDAFTFTDEVGSATFLSPIPNRDHTRLRQLYLKQNLANDSVVLGVGKFATRGNFTQSRVLGDKFRRFSSFAFALEPSFSPPIDAVGGYVRLQPKNSRVTVAGAVLDAAPDLESFDTDIDGPYVVGEVVLTDEPWRRDGGAPQPDFLLRLTGYHRSGTRDPEGGPSGSGVAATLDWRPRADWDIGVRYGAAEDALGAISHAAALGVVRDAPFGRARDAGGIALGWTRTADEGETLLGEAFYRLNVVPGLEATPFVQGVERLRGGLDATLGVRLRVVL